MALPLFARLGAVALAATLALIVACKDARPAQMPQPVATDVIGSIERRDPRLDALVPPGAVIERLATGYVWSEGPVWRKREGDLLFSDVPNNVVHRWRPGQGVDIFLAKSGYSGDAARGGEPGSNGLTLDRQGRVVLCEHGDRRIARLEADGSKTTLADRWQGKRFNSPNDLVYRSNGDLFFTDPTYGLEKGDSDPARELPFCGVYRLSAAGELSLVTRELSYPNGVALSPDERTLYVAVSDPKRAVYMAYDLAADGGVGPGRVLFDATPMLARGLSGLPDGLKVDGQGNLFATGPGGVLVLSPDGTHLGTFLTGVETANCAWGDDGSTLYVTAHQNLCRIRLTTGGAGWP